MPPFGKKPDGATGQLLSVWLRDWYPKIEDEVSEVSAPLAPSPFTRNLQERSRNAIVCVLC